MEIHTDCRSEIGITVGLIESLVSISRILGKRDMSSLEVREALKDLWFDEDLSAILSWSEVASLGLYK